MTGYTAIVVVVALPGSLKVGRSPLQDRLVPFADEYQVMVFAHNLGRS